MKLIFVRRVMASAISLLLMGWSGCSPPPNPALPVPDSVPTPNPQDVESVLFLIGDAGDALLNTSPTLARLRQDVDLWSGQLAADSAVAVLFLGDDRYPEGVRPVESSFYAGDTAVVLSQVRTVTGANALQK